MLPSIPLLRTNESNTEKLSNPPIVVTGHKYICNGILILKNGILMINLKQAEASRFSKDISQVSSFKIRRIILRSKDESIFSKTGENVA